MVDTSTSNKMLMMGLIGFAAGILFAPDKGSVTRDKLKSKADQLADEASKKTNQAKDKLSELRHRKDAAMSEMDDAVQAAKGSRTTSATT